MKKISVCLVTILLFLSVSAYAKKVSVDISSVLNSWNATTTDELHLNIINYWKESATSHPKAYSSKYFPCSIRLGGTTQELIDEKEKWDLAIVSSKEVDLQFLADEQLIMKTGYNPSKVFALHQWLLPPKVQDMLPTDSLMLYYVYCYSYNAQANEAIFLICQDNIGSKKNHPRMPERFAAEIIRKRMADDVRSLEGIKIVEAWTKNKLLVADRVHVMDGMRPIDAWTENDLIEHADEWDAAIILMDSTDQLDELERAGLLFDFSSDEYFASRTSLQPDYCKELPNGIFSADGRMIGVPCKALAADDSSTECVLILNAQSSNLQKAIAYGVHFMKSCEWDWSAENKMWPHGCDTCIYRDEVTW